VAKISIASVPWEDILIWTGLALLLYALHDVFAVVFLTFLLTYLVRAIVIPLARRISPDRERPALERGLTLGTFVAIVALLWGAAVLVVPQFILQARLLTAHAERLDPQEVLDHFLGRTVGAYLFRQTYGAPGDPRYQAAFDKFTAQERGGEGAFASFGRLQVQVQAGFEIAYEAAARARLRHQVHHGADAGPQFDQWFLEVKSPTLAAERRASYLDRLGADGSGAQSAAPGDLEHRLGELALKDLDRDPTERARLVSEWERAEAGEQWRRLRASPEYREAFREWLGTPEGIAASRPYDVTSYLALRSAYAEGMDAFKKVYRAQVDQTTPGIAQTQLDFQRAMELDLARSWWAKDPMAASLREHIKQDATEAASAIAGRLATWLRALIAIPAQVGTALLLTILISFDMVGLKKGAHRLRQGRLAHLYAKVVPNLAAVARLIGRSFAAQGVIAVFNTLLTFALMRVLGLDNELLLCSIVFIASFIPVLGIILSAIPIGLQALLQPDGSLDLALYALLGVGAIHTLESLVLSPKIVGKILHLHPVLVLAVLVVGEHLFGIWGLLLGVPLAVYAIHVAILAERIPGVYEPPQASEPVP
jgi:predicted PurR-regulated permease PerM